MPLLSLALRRSLLCLLLLTGPGTAVLADSPYDTIRPTSISASRPRVSKPIAIWKT